MDSCEALDIYGDTEEAAGARLEYELTEADNGVDSGFGHPKVITGDDMADVTAQLFESHVLFAERIIESANHYSHACKSSVEDKLLSWANDLQEMYHSLPCDLSCLTKYERDDITDLCEVHASLVQKMDLLAKEKKAKAEKNLLALRKMEHIRRSTDLTEGSSNILQKSLERRDYLRVQTHNQREIVLSYTRYPFSLEETGFEEIYLFLKEYVHNEHDLDEHKDSIHEYIFSRIDQSHSSLVPCLLELMHLENEDVLLLRKINNILEEGNLQEDIGVTSGVKYCEESQSNTVDIPSKLSELQQAHAEELEILQSALEEESRRQRQLLENRLKSRRRTNKKEETEVELSNISSVNDVYDRCQQNELEKNLSDRNRSIITGLKKKHVMIVDALSKTDDGITEEKAHIMNKKVLNTLIDENMKEVVKSRDIIAAERARQGHKTREELRKRRERAVSESITGAMLGASVPLAVFTNEPVDLERLGKKITKSFDSKVNSLNNLLRFLSLEKEKQTQSNEQMVSKWTELTMQRIHEQGYKVDTANSDVNESASRIISDFTKDFFLCEQIIVRSFVSGVLCSFEESPESNGSTALDWIAEAKSEFKQDLEMIVCEREEEKAHQRDIMLEKIKTIKNKNGAMIDSQADKENKILGSIFEEEWRVRDTTHKSCNHLLYQVESISKISYEHSGGSNSFICGTVGNEADAKAGLAKEKWQRAYSKVTKDVVRKLKARRKMELGEIIEKWRLKRKSLYAACEEKNIVGSDRLKARTEMEYAELTDLVEKDRVLTLNEHRVFESHKAKLKEEGSNENVDTNDLLNEIHKEFSIKNKSMIKNIRDERFRQSKALEERRHERQTQNHVGGGNIEKKLPFIKNDLDVEMEKLSREHEQERETLELTLELEQARQRQALHGRRATKRRNSLAAKGSLPPIMRKQGHP